MASRNGVGLALVLAILLGCTLAPQPAPGPGPEPDRDPPAEVDGRALLLLMSDQLLFEPFGVREVFRRHPELHEELAVTLGRVGDERGLPYLETLLSDPAVGVRRAAAFGLGLVEQRRAYPALLGALGDRDREVARLAADGLTRIEIPLARILPALAVLSEPESWLRLAPCLFRFSPDEIHGVEEALAGAAEAGADAGSELERWLLYALARSGDERGLPRLRAALAHSDPWLRGWAARALGRLGDASDLAPLARLLDDDEAGVVVQALRAAGALVGSGRAASSAAWRERLEELTHDPRTGVRLTAVEVAGGFGSGGPLGKRLLELAGVDDRAAELAVGSLARAGDGEAEQTAWVAAQSARVAMRRAAANAASLLELEELLEMLAADPEPSVRIASLGARLSAAGDAGGPLAREALLDRDAGVRVLALDWLSENPVAPYDELVLALPTSLRERIPELKLSGVRALAARAGAEPLERGAAWPPSKDWPKRGTIWSGARRALL